MIQAFLLSFKLAAITALVLLAFGVPLAYWLTFNDFRGRRLLEAVLLLPLTLPPTVLGFYLLVLFSADGPLGNLGLRWAFSFAGILLGSIIFSLPFALTAYKEAFRAIDPEVLDVVRTLGVSRWKRWRKVILPWIWPGLISGTLLAFAHTLGEFGVVLLVGGSIPGKTRVASIYIFDLVQALDFESAHQAAAIFVVLSLALIYAVRSLEEAWKSRIGSSIR